ncbi:hypothetical protein BH24GEM3_BH24GEM3_00190 [soil metagenome]
MISLAKLVLLAVALCVGPAALSAQTLQVEGGAEYRAVQLLREMLLREQYLLLSRDTVLPADFRTTGDLLVVDADVRVEGQVEGRVAVVGGALFVRPGARIAGSIAAVGSGVYPSNLAEVGQIVATPAGTAVEVVAVPDGFLARVASPPRQPFLLLPGAYGVRLPTYDRVDGFTLAWGPQLRLLRRPDGPTLELWGAYRSAREAVDGGARFDVPLGEGIHAVGEVARATLTNEQWIRGDLTNTLAAAFLGTDYRDYFQSDYAALTLVRPLPSGAFAPELALAPRLTLRASRDRSLPLSQTWSLFGGEGMRRENAAIDDGEILSLTAGTELAWEGTNSAFRGDLLVERAFAGTDRPDFTRWMAEGRWDLAALWNHQVSLAARAMGPLGDGPLPRQRWSFIGGTGTLPTFAIGDFRGDNLIFVQSSYAVPLTFIELPFLGSPVLRAVHAVGAAWPSGSPGPDWEQNLGLGLRIMLLDAAVYVDPARGSRRPVLSIGLVLTP